MSELDDEIKKTQLSLDSTDKANLAHIAKLRKDKADGEAIEEAYGGWSAERQFDEETLDNLLSQKLVSAPTSSMFHSLPRPHTAKTILIGRRATIGVGVC